MYELSLMKQAGSSFGTRFRRRLWRSPGLTEDWVNLARFLSPNERVLLVDIGANVGEFTAKFLSIYNNGRSICFEPVSRTYELLRSRFAEDARVGAHRIALSDRDVSAEIYLHEDNRLCSLTSYKREANEYYRTGPAQSEITTCRRLDNIEFAREPDEKLFVKIDVQGFELETILGGMQTLKTADALLLECSFADEYEGKEPSFSPACSLLRECDLYPIVFQDYGRGISNYAFERDVLFVKRHLLSKIWFRNYARN